MTRSIWLAVALCLAAVPSSVWAQQGSKATGTKAAAPADKSAEKSAPKKQSPKRGAKGKEAEPPGASEASKRARRLRAVFVYAVEACDRAGKSCDPTLREDAEQRFLEACGTCAPSARCEAQRDDIRRGETPSAASDPCAP